MRIMDKAITKLKSVLSQMLCNHEWQQVGQIETDEAHGDDENMVYYAHMKCVKCGKDMFEVMKIPAEMWK